MRLKAKTTMGYVPTPDKTLAHLKTWLSRAGDEASSLKSGQLYRLLDPCCGKGEALSAIAQAIGPGPIETYGIELSDERAAAAESVLTHVINTAYEHMTLTDETFSFTILNPAYDGETMTGGGQRLEETFLYATTPRLAPGGVLVFIIPHKRINEKMARHLFGWYDGLHCFKLPPDEYEIYNQVVILGMRRAEYQHARSDDLDALLAWQGGNVLTGYVMVEVEDKEVKVEAKAEAEGQAETGAPKKTKKVRQPTYAELPWLVDGQGEYAIPAVGQKGKHGAPFRFQYIPYNDEEFLAAAVKAATRLETSREWQDLLPRLEPDIIIPAITPKRGNIGQEMIGGLLGTNALIDADGNVILLKGNVFKSTHVKRGEFNLDNEPGNGSGDKEHPELYKVELEEVFDAMITTVDGDGQMTEHRTAEDIKRILDEYIEQIARIVETRNVPRYDMKPELWEWAVFDNLALSCRLPGRKETGLTDFQKHLAIALGRLSLAVGAAVANAEMASGKSKIGLAVVEYIHAALQRRVPAKAGLAKRSPYPVFIIGPAIVTNPDNWPKEIAETIPGAASRVIECGARAVPKSARLGDWLQTLRSGTGKPFALNADEYEGYTAAKCLAQIRKAARKQDVPLTDTVSAALAYSLKQAEKSPPRRRNGARQPNLLDGRIGGFCWLGLDVPRDPASAKEIAGKYSLMQFVQEYKARLLPARSFLVASFETCKLGPGRVPAMNSKHIKVRYEDEGGKRVAEIVEVCTCPECGAIVADEYDEGGHPIKPIHPGREAEEWIGLRRRFCQALRPRWVWEEAGAGAHGGGKQVLRCVDNEDVPYVCGAPLFSETALHREAAARLARRAGVFGALIVDEVHKCKAAGTGAGQTLMTLRNACSWAIGLSGTVFGGYSTDLFMIMFRMFGEVREAFGFRDEKRWAEKYGLVKTTFFVTDPNKVAEDGAYTGTKLFETVSQKPGISPMFMGLGLKYCTFSSLQDIGLPLPEYEESLVRIDMTEAMAAQYAEADGSQDEPPSGLFAWALDRMEQEDGKGALSVWLNTSLNRPDAMFRDEEVVFHPRVSGRGRFAVRRNEAVQEFTSVTGPGEWLPKEQWLAQKCLEERREGRKVLVYVRQTGTRDIQPRLAEALQAAGLRAGVLKPSLAPVKRAPWLKANAPKYDVLLTNARLVEVGLNLTMFNTAVFYEIEWSLAIVWQAMRRLYRPGAPKKVRVFFPVYEGTQEAYALDLLGHKMMAAQVLYGDNVSGALVDEIGTDLLHDLVNKAMNKVEIGRAEGVFSIGSAPAITMSPIGCPTMPSPVLDIASAKLWVELVARRQEIVKTGKRARKQVASQGSLF